MHSVPSKIGKHLERNGLQRFVVEQKRCRENEIAAENTANHGNQRFDATIEKLNSILTKKAKRFLSQTNVPSLGYKTYEITTEAGRNVSTLKAKTRNKTEIKNDNFQIKIRADGNVESIYDLRQKREIVNDKGELPFNELLRVEGSDASKIAYPFAPKISVRHGEQMTQICGSNASVRLIL